jgi:hypothetical protein
VTVNYFPVIITGQIATIYPHSDVLTNNQTYYVMMDPGIVADSSGEFFAGIANTNSWRFTTKPYTPANPASLVVATDGSGDFDTVQGAVDSIPLGNTNRVVINIHDGNYVEIIDVSSKNNLTIAGQSRAGTVVGYPNNNNINPGSTTRMAFKVNSSGINLENLTVLNSTPQGGSQAEALNVSRGGYQCIINHCNLDSRQDTILLYFANSQAYFNQCEIEGNEDYIWGGGVGYFNDCIFDTIINSLDSYDYDLTAARTVTSSNDTTITPWVNPNGDNYSAYGFSFVNCTLEADQGIGGITLADSSGTPGGLDSWVKCLIDTNAYVSPPSDLANSYVFWQCNNRDIIGALAVSFTNVQTIGATNVDPRLIAATNPAIWFSGWMPQLAAAPPTILPAGGTFVEGVAITIQPPDTNALIYYTLDGTLPTSNSLSYNGPFNLTNTATVSAIAFESNLLNSIAPSALFTIVPGVRFTGTEVVSNGMFTLQVSGPPSSAYILESSTNLESWIPLVTNFPSATPFYLADPNTARMETRFYRVLQRP